MTPPPPGQRPNCHSTPTGHPLGCVETLMGRRAQAVHLVLRNGAGVGQLDTFSVRTELAPRLEDHSALEVQTSVTENGAASVEGRVRASCVHPVSSWIPHLEDE